MEFDSIWANPAAGKAGIAPQMTIGHHGPGLPEPGLGKVEAQ